MKTRKSRLKSFFAMLLVVSMVCQQSSLTVLATDDTYVEDEIVTPTPSGSEAEEYTEEKTEPEAEESEEPVAEEPEEPQEEPETPAEEPAQEPTEAPAEQPTEAPAAEPTEAPAEQPTEAPAAAPTETPAAEVTETPATPEATATPTPEVSAVPSETPTPTITSAPELTNQFQSNYGNINATVLLGDNKLEKDSTSFLVEEKSLESEYVFDFVDQAMNDWCASRNLTILDAAVFDMHFEGKKVQNIGNATVNIEFANPILGSISGEVYVLHIKDGVAYNVTESIAQNSDGTVSGAVINTDGFSPFVFVKTTKEASVQFATEASTNLNGFVTDVEFKNEKYDADGKLILYPGSEYSFTLSFAESEGNQMDVEKELEYTYPSELTPTGQSGTFSVEVKRGAETYIVSGNSYTIEGNKIKVKLNQNDPNFEHLKNASNVNFKIHLSAKINDDASGEKISFSDKVEKDVNFKTDGIVNVTKTGNYDKEKGKFNYEVTVSATGTCKNVEIKDNITGTLLKYDKNLVADPVLTNAKVTKEDDNGFTYKIPKMVDGETVKLTYSASVNYSEIGNETEFTEGQTKNTVIAKGDNTPSNSAEKDFAHTTISGGISKTVVSNETVLEGDTQTNKWKIIVNPDALQYVGGNTVTDTLAPDNKVKMKYSGKGLVVKIYDKAGNLIETKTPTWAELKSFSEESSWKYVLPENSEKRAYKYEIEYTTETDISKVLDDNNSYIKNNASDGNGGNATGSTNASKNPNNKFEVDKSHKNATENSVDWTVKVKIPESGFSESFTVSDNLPDTWINNIHYIDKFKRGSLKIMLGDDRELVEGSDYTIDIPDDGNSFSVEFQNVANLFPAGVKGRVLTLTYQTIPDPKWPKASNSHDNTVTVIGDGIEKKDTDSFRFGEHKMTKSSVQQETRKDGLTYYKFDILLEGVDSESITIKDQFESEFFELYDPDKTMDPYWAV